MTLGAQTVTLVSVGEDATDRDENGQPRETRTETPITGCRFRMVGATETTTPGDRVVESWKLTAPPYPVALLTATSRDRLRYGADEYAIVGSPRKVLDLDGSVHHVSVTAQRSRA